MAKTLHSCHSHPPHSRGIPGVVTPGLYQAEWCGMHRPGLQCRSDAIHLEPIKLLTRALLTSQHPILLLLTELSQQRSLTSEAGPVGTSCLAFSCWQAQSSNIPQPEATNLTHLCIKSSQFNQTGPSFLLEKEVAFFLDIQHSVSFLCESWCCRCPRES